MSLAEELGYSFKDEKCYSPRQVVSKTTGEVHFVPCGKCLPCLRRRQSEWIVRLKQEIKKYDPGTCFFITLTYAEDTVPLTPEGVRTLDKDDFKRFFNRMRSLVGKGGFLFKDPQGILENGDAIPVNVERRQFKYYFTSEYGPQTNRPHGHAILFNFDPTPGVVDMLVHKCWPNGFVSVFVAREDDPGFIGYVTKYLVNNMLAPSSDVLPPFSLMSKGLGLDYIEKYQEWHSRSLARFYTQEHGQRNILPRYYRDRLYLYTERDEHARKIRKDLDKRDQRLAARLDTVEKLNQFSEERNRYQRAQMYSELQLMLKKHKIK